jgi:hypothetical protein
VTEWQTLSLAAEAQHQIESTIKEKHKHVPNFLETRQRKQQIIQGGSDHALDTMLESNMQNIEIQSDG